MDKLTPDTIWSAVIVIFVLLAAYNTFAVFRKNARDETTRRQAPLEAVRNNVERHDLEIKELERRVDALEDDSKDLHAGQSALCRGVQALLEHELHNGNDEEMRGASDAIGKWLRNH